MIELNTLQTQDISGGSVSATTVLSMIGFGIGALTYVGLEFGRESLGIEDTLATEAAMAGVAGFVAFFTAIHNI